MDRIQALETLLPLLHVHHAMIAAIRSSVRYSRTPDGELVEPAIDCDVECKQGGRCPARDRCPDEAWVIVQRGLSSRYRLWAVSLSLQKLQRELPALAAGVYHEHVEPWREWNPGRREAWAREGLRWMADEIPGELYTFRPQAAKVRASNDERDGEIRRLLEAGQSVSSLSARFGVSSRRIRQICAVSVSAGGDA